MPFGSHTLCSSRYFTEEVLLQKRELRHNCPPSYRMLLHKWENSPGTCRGRAGCAPPPQTAQSTGIPGFSTAAKGTDPSGDNTDLWLGKSSAPEGTEQAPRELLTHA